MLYKIFELTKTFPKIYDCIKNMDVSVFNNRVHVMFYIDYNKYLLAKLNNVSIYNDFLNKLIGTYLNIDELILTFDFNNKIETKTITLKLKENFMRWL